MRYKELIIEGKNTPSIVVDVQPAYTGPNSYNGEWSIVKLMSFLNKQHGPILALCNAEADQLTDDTLDDIKMYWEDNGFTNWDNVTWYDKGYGYLREAMDQVNDDVIIHVIREMYQQKITDSRDLFNEDMVKLIEFIESVGGTEEDATIISYGISVEWISTKLLKEHAGYIMGGGREECLREIELIMSAFNITHKQIKEFIF